MSNVVLFLAVACTETLPDGVVAPLDVRAERDVESETSLTVSWTTDEPADAALEFGLDSSYGERLVGSSSEDGRTHAVVLAGLTPEEVWHWRAVSGEQVSADQTFEPAYAPAELPQLLVTGEHVGLILAPILGGTSYVALYDGEGIPVWWRRLGGMESVTQARLSADGRDVLVMGMISVLGTSTVIARLPIAGGEPTVVEIDAHHDFIELASGGYATILPDIREYDGVRVQGDSLVEVSLDGTVRTVWSTWDHAVPSDVNALFVINEVGDRDWTHMNSIAWKDGNYWLSSPELESIFVVHGETGATVARIGGEGSDVELVAGEGFGPQHAVLPTKTGFLVFNNRSGTGADAWGEAVAYDLNLRTREYARVWSYDGQRSLTTQVLGNVEPTAGGHLVSWGAAGHLTALDADHEAVWGAQTAMGSAFGYAHPVAALSGVP